eukprot:2609349-Pleurochrysis_carterae.AAC.1
MECIYSECSRCAISSGVGSGQVPFNTPECEPLALPSINWPCGNAMKPVDAQDGNRCICSCGWCVEHVRQQMMHNMKCCQGKQA